MKWIILGIAGAMEITWAVAMKYSGGFTQLIPSVITAVSYIASAVFLALALKNLPLGTAYAIWTGIGIIGTSVLGMLLFKETVSLPQWVCIAMIVIGIIGLRLLSSE
ncbi:DMT family transporter [Hornefia butyriciproducens]|uniref:Multidrug efflux SMR transporter n=1 Tax=Hornefia butyriciproducens TaxID=2652293 RepID=A0A6L5Y5B7_9FIRM|nr:multidrug efflux SMR transporter [Hornefia butyriciproducens]MST50997.1 multidrug efflux SMR transporter [Hornefia butyriciproducens]